MSEIQNLSVPKLEGFTIEFAGESGITLAGVLSNPDPRETVGPFFEALHKAAVSDHVETVDVNLRELTFVNSSAIRLFVDWVGRLSADNPEYVLHFLTNRRVTWQRTSFDVLRSLAPKAVRITST